MPFELAAILMVHSIYCVIDTGDSIYSWLKDRKKEYMIYSIINGAYLFTVLYYFNKYW